MGRGTVVPASVGVSDKRRDSCLLSTHLDCDVLEQRVLQDSLQFAVDFQRQLQCHAGVNHARLEHRGHDATMARQAGLGGARDDR